MLTEFSDNTMVKMEEACAFIDALPAVIEGGTGIYVKETMPVAPLLRYLSILFVDRVSQERLTSSGRTHEQSALLYNVDIEASEDNEYGHLLLRLSNRFFYQRSLALATSLVFLKMVALLVKLEIMMFVGSTKNLKRLKANSLDLDEIMVLGKDHLGPANGLAAQSLQLSSLLGPNRSLRDHTSAAIPSFLMPETPSITSVG
ncbi:hypothetical protein FLONG3_7444 [Fusarium longipes]|uniref:Uncharacterized protein n=1 Tax=Fusarium longipes TaxID=694270 RepID=A0A395SDN6_9HYPO|nr:hypothetical protein FLONG3_7444 [Fusarium longipes]